MKKKHEVTVVQETSVAATVPSQDTSVETFISQAIAANLPVETMERLFALRKEVKAEAAREAFVRAMSQFQSECPIIEKTKKVLNKDGRSVRYMYAPTEAIVEQTKGALGRAGLAYTWTVEHKDNHMHVTCKITHVLGHFEVSSLDIPIDTEGYMTAPQKYASAQTFAKRYTLCNALGIATGDEDTDATDVNDEKDVKDPREKIINRLRMLGEKNETPEGYKESVMRLTKLELVPANFEEIISRLEIVISERHESPEVR
jgi:hypothetical protein